MQGEAPKVTVVVPCFNMGEFLAEAVGSVLAQTFTDFELIVVDDGSDDPGTKEVLEKLRVAGIRVLSTENRGVACARNHGIRAARGSYLVALDADDVLEPSFLAKTVQVMEEDPEVGIVGCDAGLTGAASGVLRLPEFSRQALLSRNLLFATALFRKRDWERGGGYCSAFRYGWEDWDFWIALTRFPIKVVRLPEALFRYRIRPFSRDRSMSLLQKGRMMLLLLARHWRHYLKSPAALAGLALNAGASRNRNET